MSMFGAVDLSTLVPREGAQQPDRTAGGAAPGADGASGEGVPAPLVVDVDASTLRDVAQVSTQVPVVIVLRTPRSQVSEDLASQLETLAHEYAGRFELGRVDVDGAPEVAQALQATAVPTVVALLAGQPVPMFQGAIPDDQLRSLLDQLLDVAAQNGVNGRLAVTDAEGAEEPAEPEETEVERAAREALARGDYAAAEEVYDHAIAQDPADDELRLARDQIRMMRRMEGQDPAALIAAADADPGDLDRALAAADASLALGDVDAALGRALEAVRGHEGDEREKARKRLLELFDVIGAGAPEVARARRQLATLLF